MATLGVAIFMTVLTLVHGIQPLLSTPGNATVLMLMDIHTGYFSNGTCSDPQWDRFEIAQALLVTSMESEFVGLEVYDTCGSGMRAQEIVKERLVSEKCSGTGKPPVSGLMTHVSTDVNEAISAVISISDVLFITVTNGLPETADYFRKDDSFRVELASRQKISFLNFIMRVFKWEYISIFSDNNPVSNAEHQMFLSSIKGSDVCVQYSETLAGAMKINPHQIKTPGVVIFASDLEHISDFINEIPSSSAVLVVAQDKSSSGFMMIKNGVVLRGNFPEINNVSDHMTTLLGNDLDQITTEYFTNQHNCSVNATSKALNCSNIDRIRAQVSATTSGQTIYTLNEILKFLSDEATHMLGNNCTDFSKSRCFDSATINQKSNFKVENWTFVSSSEDTYNLVFLENGLQTSTLDDIPSTVTEADLITLIQTENIDISESVCDSWCPTCFKFNRDSAINDLTGNHRYIPGDIALAGLFPASESWNPKNSPACSGVATETNTDFLAEAFLFAVSTYQQRYPTLLPNVSVGALILDTCSDIKYASQTLVNFESGFYKFPRTGNEWELVPNIVPAYLSFGADDFLRVAELSDDMDKIGVNVDENGNIVGQSGKMYDASVYNVDVVVELLKSMEWTSVGILSSAKEQFDLQPLFHAAIVRNICIEYHAQISDSLSQIEAALDKLRNTQSSVIIIFAHPEETALLFRSLTSNPISTKTWVLVEKRNVWFDFTSFPLPLGSLVIKNIGNTNNDFNEYIQNTTSSSQTDAHINPFSADFRSARSSCASCPDPSSDTDTLMEANDVIKVVDATLHAIHNSYVKVCKDLIGLCEKFAAPGSWKTLVDLGNVTFTYQNEVVDLSSRKRMLANFRIYNLQRSGLAEVGSWINKTLTLEKAQVLSYTSRGDLLEGPRPSSCVTRQCICLNNATNTSILPDNVKVSLDQEMGYVKSSAEFDDSLWSLIVVIIAGSGSLLTITLMIFIMCKVCAGAVIRRYLALGIMLLVAMVFLFLSVLPYVFSPSEPVCGMRFFAHGFSYAFCFAIILAKLMTLRDYKYIGLGGEISRINQMLTVFFITVVQVAIGVEWWVLRPQTFFTHIVTEYITGITQVEVTYYACDFDRGDFVAYHCYVLFLIVVCCLYSISVRKETKNMKEAKLLFICSWFCLLLWIAIIVCLFVLDRKYVEAICAIGCVANSLTMLVIIYVPKLTAISRLKYEVSDQGKRKENGYKIDPDFQFERPYSLPGTMHSSITEKTLSYPRSLAAFDTSLSY